MSFQGTLGSVSLADILQTLSMNRQTGTLDVQRNGEQRLVWFQDGAILMADAPPIDDQPALFALLERRGIIDRRTCQTLCTQHQRSGQDQRALAAMQGGVNEEELDLVCSMWIEERIYEIFQWPDGTFTFTDGELGAAFAHVDIVAMGEAPVQTPQVVMSNAQNR